MKYFLENMNHPVHNEKSNKIIDDHDKSHADKINS